jgi:hypothetical protein
MYIVESFLVIRTELEAADANRHHVHPAI